MPTAPTPPRNDTENRQIAGCGPSGFKGARQPTAAETADFARNLYALHNWLRMKQQS